MAIEALKQYAELPRAVCAEQRVTGSPGPFFGGNYADWGQLSASSIRVVTNIIFVRIRGIIWFKVSDKICPLRSSRPDELDGLDMPEMGVETYPDHHLSDRTSPSAQ